MNLKRYLSPVLGVLTVVIAISALTASPAQAISYDYTVTGTLTGTFNADLSVSGGSFNSWNLTTPTATFTNTTGTTLYNANFTLLQTQGSNALGFLIVPPASSSTTYVGLYRGNTDAGAFTGSFARATLPLPDSTSLLLIGLAAFAGAQWFRRNIAHQIVS